MVAVGKVATALPQFCCSTDQIIQVARTWLLNAGQDPQLFERLTKNSGIQNRYFALPVSDLVKLNGAEERAEIFQTEGSKLLESAISQALAEASLSAKDVATLIFVSCSVPTIPSLDAHVLPGLGFSAAVNRIPVYQHGCLGGAFGLSLASRLVAEGPVVVASVELCSLIYHASDLRSDNVVGAALFGDGAAAVVLSEEPKGLSIRASRSHLISNSTQLMGYDVKDAGAHLRLDREIPNCIAAELPSAVENFLADQGLSSKEIGWWLVHPGGAKILRTVESFFELKPEQMQWSWEVLKQFGNMSSASLLFALKLFQVSEVSKTGQKALMVGIGPGLTIQMILFDCL